MSSFASIQVPGTSSTLVVPQALRFGGSGPAVTSIQTYLLQLGFKLAPTEVVNSSYGLTTRLAVVQFQTKHQLPSTGVVDETTALLLLQESEQLENPNSFVFGTITQPNGSTGAYLTVRVTHRDLRREHSLGTVVSDAAGLYECCYLLKKGIAEEFGSANLIIRVFHGQELLYEPTTAEITFNAPAVAVINIALTTGNSSVLDQYNAILSRVRPLLKHQGVDLDDLREDDKKQDITYLTRETKMPPGQLISLVVASKLATMSDIQADFFYGVITSNLLTASSQTSATGMRPGVGLNSDLEAVFYDIVLAKAAGVSTTINNAVQANLVPKSLLDQLPQIQETLTKWTRAANEYLKNNPPQSQIITQIGQLYNDGKIDSVIKLMQQRNFGDLSSVLNGLADIFSAPSSSQFSGTSLHPSASNLGTESKTHTARFAAQLKSAKRGVFGEHDNIILHVLENNPGFDLASGSVESVFKNLPTTTAPSVASSTKTPSTDDYAASKQMLKSIQRVFKLAPSLPQTKALITGGLKSSAHIHSLGKTQFLKKFASKPDHAFTPEQGAAVFKQAENMHIATTLLAGNIQTASSALTLGSISPPIEKTQIQAVVQNFPTMKSLFHLGDVCSCDDCMTVYSPSAYLVDVLEFISNRKVIDTTAGTAPTSGPAKTVLFNRRPDLGDLDLSCANTNTTLPYIDYVCELLENQVVADPTQDLNRALTTGPVSATLLQTLISKAYAFTTKATVSDPDLSTKSRIIRDDNLVVKAVPNTTSPTPDWTLRVLRQTFQTSDQLAAAPEYVNDGAYAQLALSQFAFSLPFDLPHQEATSYFTQFGVKRAHLMRILKQTGSPPLDIHVASEELRITSDELTLITVSDPTGQQKYWNPSQPADLPVPPAGSFLQTMSNVEVFTSTSGLTYALLQSLLALGLQQAQPSWLNPESAMFVQHLDSSCNLSKKVISGLDLPGLDRLHRFIRLWLKLNPKGWDFATLDQAIVAAKIGNSTLDQPCLQKISEIEIVRSMIGSTMSPSDCVSLYAGLVLIGVGSRYAQVFLNVAAVGVVDPAFLPDNVLQNEANETAHPGSGTKISVYATYLALCLGRSQADMALLLQTLPSHGSEILSSDSISAVYSRHLFALRLRLSITDLITLEQLFAVPELQDPGSTIEFLKRLTNVRASGLSPDDIQYFLRFQSVTLTQRALNDEVATQLLSTLQTAYFSIASNTSSPFNQQASVADNTPPVLALAAQLPGFTSSDATILSSIIAGSPSIPAPAFIDNKFGVLMDTSKIHAAQTALAAATSTNLASLQLAFISVMDTAFSIFNAKYSALMTAVTQLLSIDSTLSPVILEFAIVSAASNQTIVRILTDDALIPASATGPPPTPTTFDAQYRGLRLLYDVNSFAQKMSIGTNDMQWLLQNSTSQSWMSPAGVKYQADVSDVSFDSWRMLYLLLQLATQLPPVTNPANQNLPFTMYGLFALVDTAGTSLSIVMDYLVQLTGWDRQSLDSLNTRFGLSVPAYKDPVKLQLLNSILSALRIMSIDVASAVAVIKPKLLAADAALLRAALKTHYDDASWLAVLKNIMDPLRLMKRDALVNYILATNPSFTSSDDLYDYFLIDVEMGSQMLTSRIVQAHATVQLFVQRCLMALEPTCVADTADDSGWLQWTWMSQYRVWEANRQIFLWPETWIQPELRDNKSEIYLDAENKLQQNQLTSLNAESCLIQYLESLNGISQLDVVALYYQVELRTLHIFARTKGGDPLVYYYRQLIQEKNWTPWTKLNVDIKSDQIVAFTRNGRLSLAWLEISTETEQQTTTTIPDPSNIGPNTQTYPPMQRLNIQLAISEFSLAGVWTPKAVSKDPLYWPYNGAYESAQNMPPLDEIHILCWDLGTSGGQTITVSTSLDFLESNPLSATILQYLERTYGIDDNASLYLGSFSLTGCKGYPEPAPMTNTTFLELLPQFRNCQMDPQDFIKLPPSAGPVSINDYAMKNFFSPYDFESILSVTYGTHKTAYPMQMTILDWLAILFGVYWRYNERLIIRTDIARIRPQPPTVTNLDLGTFLPFVHNDPSRTWVVIPDLWERIFLPFLKSKVVEMDTCSNLFDFVDRFTKIVQKYYYPPTLVPDFKTLLNDILGDSDFQTLVTDVTVALKLNRGYKFINFYHPLICYLISTANTSGVPGLLSLSTQLKTNDFVFATTYTPTSLVFPAHPKEDVNFDLTDAYGSYNWELFFHFPFEVASQLNQGQLFQDAQNWLHYIFNPVGGTSAAPNKYWNMKFFYETSISDYTSELIDNIMKTIAGDPVSVDPTSRAIANLAAAVADWRQNPFSPHVIARGRPVTYQIAVVLKYVKNLLDWGDNLFGQYTRETITAATQLYILADKLLGPKPQQVPPAFPTPIQTFNQLESNLDIFGNALIDLENLIPVSTLPHGGKELPTPPPPGVTPVVFSSLYFAIPQNSYVLQYWDTVADRLFKIRNSENINGVFVPVALFSPPIDPGALVRALASGASLSSILSGLTAPQPIYRFETLIQKASDLVTITSSLGIALLSAFEKRDSEALARLRGDQEIVVLNAVRLTKVAGITEATSALTALQLSRKSALERQTYYTSRPYMNTWENVALGLSGASLALDIGVILGYLFGGGAKAAPTFTAGAAGFGGSPVFMVAEGGEQIGGSAETIATSLSSVGRALDKAAALASQQGSYQRRQDDWDFNGRLATDDLATIDEQINTGALHLAMLNSDLAAHDASITATQKVNDFMKSKYTNKELYDWMAGQISSIYFSTYKLAFNAAKVAERALLAEVGDDSGTTYISYGYWDSLHSGLLAAESLQHDVKRLETAYLQQNVRYYELTKNVSLADLDPYALITLRATGKCIIQVPEEIFDMDHPGHYFRRNKGVAVSIPCVVGPQKSVSAKLTLLSNKYRMNSVLHPVDPSNPNPQPQDPYIENPVGGDERFRYNVGAVQSIALSSGVNDSGMFEFNFRDERYLPFENTGAIGSYQLELPIVVQQFDYNTITDIILHIHYTAREGGSTLQSAVEAGQLATINQMTIDAQKFGVYQAYDLRHQFSSEWTQLLKTNATQVTFHTRFLPFFVQKHTPTIESVVWFARVKGDPALYTILVGAAAPPANGVVLKKQVTLGNLLVSDELTRSVVLDTAFALGLSTTGTGTGTRTGAGPALLDLTALVHFTLSTS